MSSNNSSKGATENLEKIDNTLSSTKKIYYSILDKQLHENIFKPLNETLVQRQQTNVINRYNNNNSSINNFASTKFNTGEFHESLDDLTVALSSLKNYLIMKEKVVKEEKKQEILESNKYASSQNNIINTKNIIDNDLLLDTNKNSVENMNPNDPFNLDNNSNTINNNFGLEGLTSATNNNRNASNTNTSNSNNNQSLADFGLDLSMFGLDNNMPTTGTDALRSMSNKSNNLGSSVNNNNSNSTNTTNNNANFEFNFDWE